MLFIDVHSAMIHWCLITVSHGRGVHCTSYHNKLWDSKDFHCKHKLIFPLFITALALREHLVIYVKLHSVAQGEDETEYFQKAYQQTVTEEKKTVATKQIIVTALYNCLQQFTVCHVFWFAFEKQVRSFDLHDAFVWRCLVGEHRPLGVNTVDIINLELSQGFIL